MVVMKTLGCKKAVLTPLFILAVFLMFLRGIEAKSPVQIKAEIDISVGRERSIIVTPEMDFRIDIWTNRPWYYAGDDIRIYFHAARDCYVYIFDIDPNGTTRQIFPNYFDQDNFIRGGNTYSIPDYGYHLEVTGPPGTEYLRVMAVRERHHFLRDYDMFDRSDPFPRHPGGVESFRQKLESRGVDVQESPVPRPRNGQERNLEAEYPSRSLQREGEERTPETEAPYKDAQGVRPDQGRMSVVPRPSYPPSRPPYRDYAESYTSFNVRSRWYEPDEDYRQPVRTRKILFRSIPDDALLYIDGVYFGKTSQKLKLSYGPHRVRMRKPGYYDWVRSVYVNEDTEAVIAARMDRSHHDYEESYREEWDWEYKDLDRERMFRGRGRERSEISPPGLKEENNTPGIKSSTKDSLSTREEQKLRRTEMIAPNSEQKDKEREEDQE